jgi:hypothetical protein
VSFELGLFYVALTGAGSLPSAIDRVAAQPNITFFGGKVSSLNDSFDRCPYMFAFFGSIDSHQSDLVLLIQVVQHCDRVPIR